MAHRNHKTHGPSMRTRKIGPSTWLPSDRQHKSFTPEQRKWLVSLAQERPDFSQLDLARKFFREFGMDISHQTIARWIKDRAIGDGTETDEQGEEIDPDDFDDAAEQRADEARYVARYGE